MGVIGFSLVVEHLLGLLYEVLLGAGFLTDFQCDELMQLLRHLKVSDLLLALEGAL